LIPGVLGSITGAYLLDVIDGDVIKPFIAVYMIVGSVIIRKQCKKNIKRKRSA
jgi:uncharacterized membrane protein YfcA